MPKKCKRGTFWAFSTSIQLPNIKKIEGDPLKIFENISKSLTVPGNMERGNLLLWNGFLFHVRGFGHVQNEVVSTYGKTAKCTKTGSYSVSLHCMNHFLCILQFYRFLLASPLV